MNKVAIFSAGTHMGKTRELIRIFDDNIGNKISTLYITIEERAIDIISRVESSLKDYGYSTIVDCDLEEKSIYDVVSDIRDMDNKPECIIIDSIMLIADGASLSEAYMLLQGLSDEFGIDFIVSRQLPLVFSRVRDD